MTPSLSIEESRPLAAEFFKKIGLLTGGGDCPGLNAAIRAVVRRAHQLGIGVFAVYEGFKGLVEGNVAPFPLRQASGILHVGGTILRSSRFNPFKSKENLQALRQEVKKRGLQGLVVIGGEGSLRLACDLTRKKIVRCIGIPKTIDNDVYGTDVTIGFQTAVNTATEAVDKLHTTAESHNVVMVVEVMGRHTGWIAASAGLAGGADLILMPEKRLNEESIRRIILNRHARGKKFSIVVVAEDARVVNNRGRVVVSMPTSRDDYGPIKSSGVGEGVARLIRRLTGFETRVVVLGHVQRGGSPTPEDRILATRFGVLAAELAAKNKWNRMTAIRNGKILSVPLNTVTGRIKKVDPGLYRLANYFFG
ncbi:MAG: 6-phosphofructokinase [Deltaproteobacteria bacterium]|nr:6-phosphofructokinase [Deltaproteobacteria bacterium]